MSSASIRVGVGTRFCYDGEVVKVVEFLGTTAGCEVVLKNATGQRIVQVSVIAGLDAATSHNCHTLR
jgi:hypothetical protein